MTDTNESGEQLYIHVVGWSGFQHYADRDPRWIKTYTRLLADRNYLSLPLRLRAILHGIWLLYAASGRDLGASPAQLGRMLGATSVRTRDIERLSDAGFIVVSASNVLAQNREEERREETPLVPLPETEPLASVYRTLSAVDKPGYQPPKFTPERLTPLLARFPSLDLAAEAEKLADWERYGKGEQRTVRDGIAALRNWLERAKPPLAAVADPDEVPPGYNRGTYRRLTPADQAWYPGQEETA